MCVCVCVCVCVCARARVYRGQTEEHTHIGVTNSARTGQRVYGEVKRGRGEVNGEEKEMRTRKTCRFRIPQYSIMYEPNFLM